MLRPPEVRLGENQAASVRPLGMGPQPDKGGYKKLVTGPTPDGGCKCWKGNKAGRNFGEESVEMTSLSQAALELQEDAQEVGGKPSKTIRPGRNFGEESGEKPAHSQASLKFGRDEAGRNFGEKSSALPSSSTSLELQAGVSRVG
eukprot:8981804-Karenia_brevis.AAC.1